MWPRAWVQMQVFYAPSFSFQSWCPLHQSISVWIGWMYSRSACKDHLPLPEIGAITSNLNCISTRPAHNTSTHVSLHYSGFSTFVDECSSVDIDSTDTMFITELTTRMSGEYAKWTRPHEVFETISEYFSPGVSISWLEPNWWAINFPNPLLVSKCILCPLVHFLG